MDAQDKLSIVSIVFSALIGTYLFLFKIGVGHHIWLMAIVLFLVVCPLIWIGGLNTMEFLTKPFVEKGLKGFFSWIVVLILSVVVYGAIGAGLYFLFNNLELL